MKIGVVADSHDNIPAIRKAVATFNGEGVTAILHAGDFVAPFAAKEFLKANAPLIGVFGNNDGERTGLAKILKDIQPGPRLVELGGVRIALAHAEDALAPGLLEQAPVAVFGHTHQAVVKKGKVLRLNPGECGGWLSGRCTIAILDTQPLDVRIVDLM